MRLRNNRGLLHVVLALIALSVMACSSTPPPCNVEPGQVDQARSDLQVAEQSAEQAASEAAAIESEISSLQGKVVSSDELAKLEQHLAELKKGSGR